MQSLSKEYLVLFNALTDAENTLLNLRASLINAQRLAEDIYISTTNMSEAQEEAALIEA
jgi:hypothetical protein